MSSTVLPPRRIAPCRTAERDVREAVRAAYPDDPALARSMTKAMVDHAAAFWNETVDVSPAGVAAVVERLRRYGGMDGWWVADEIEARTHVRGV